MNFTSKKHVEYVWTKKEPACVFNLYITIILQISYTCINTIRTKLFWIMTSQALIQKNSGLAMIHFKFRISMFINSTLNFRNLQREASAVCSWWRAEQGGSGSFDGIPSAALHPSRNCGCCSYWDLWPIVRKGDTE